MLHLTNGDVAADLLRAASVTGDVVPWRDVLHEGPIPAGLDAGELRARRAAFLAGVGWGDEDAIRADLAWRDGALRHAIAAGAEVVLWFEHDLYDQLQLLQVIDAATAHEADERGQLELPPARLTWVRVPGEYVSDQSPAALARALPRRERLSDAQRALARRAWAAVRAPDPHGLDALRAEPDAAALPDLPAALTRFLEELPDVRDGLSRLERQTLEAVAGGAHTVGEAFPRAHRDREPAVFLGDAAFALLVARLAQGAQPLLAAEDGARLIPPTAREDPAPFWRRALRLTPAGDAVLAGGADHVRLNEPERWLGGVRLGPGEPDYRWNGERVVRVD